MKQPEHRFLSQSEGDTAALAAGLAGVLRPGDVVFLDGDLGMGKSVFARSLVRALTGIAGLEVPSPTFTLVQTYDADPAPVWHFDLYRIKSAEEVWELGWEDALQDIVLVEWPSRLMGDEAGAGPGDAGLAPPSRLEIGFTPHNTQENSRIITLTPRGAWAKRWDSAFWDGLKEKS